MAAKIKKGDLVEVVRGRTSDSKKMNARNARRDAEGLEPLAAGTKASRVVSSRFSLRMAQHWSKV